MASEQKQRADLPSSENKVTPAVCKNTSGPLLGVFELDKWGTVLYCSIETKDGLLRRAHEFDGSHFFTDVVWFKNADSFSRRFDHFRMSPNTTYCFDFTFEFEDGPSPARVLLARFNKTQDEVSFLVYLRAGQQAKVNPLELVSD